MRAKVYVEGGPLNGQSMPRSNAEGVVIVGREREGDVFAEPVLIRPDDRGGIERLELIEGLLGLYWYRPERDAMVWRLNSRSPPRT